MRCRVKEARYTASQHGSEHRLDTITFNGREHLRPPEGMEGGGRTGGCGCPGPLLQSSASVKHANGLSRLTPERKGEGKEEGVSEIEKEHTHVYG